MLRNALFSTTRTVRYLRMLHIPNSSVTSLIGLPGVPSIPAVGEPFRFNMQEKKTASFALVDDESLDPTGLFKKQTVIDLIKKIEHRAHMASVGLAISLESTFQSKFPEHKPANPTY